jgi:hypothetical protein
MSINVGKEMRVTSTSRSTNDEIKGQEAGGSTSSTRSEELILKPSDFTRLRKMSDAIQSKNRNDWYAEAILWQSGSQFDGRPYLKMKVYITIT